MESNSFGSMNFCHHQSYNNNTLRESSVPLVLSALKNPHLSSPDYVKASVQEAFSSLHNGLTVLICQ